MSSNSQLTKKVAEIYDWLDLQINNNSDAAGKCEACGKCCVFDTPASESEQGFDHRLFLTTPELMYLTSNIRSEDLKAMTTNRCPYNIEGKCSVYEYRFAGCRIFCCNGDKNFQSQLSESVIKKFKIICEESGIVYRYTDLATALNNSTVT